MIYSGAYLSSQEHPCGSSQIECSNVEAVLCSFMVTEQSHKSMQFKNTLVGVLGKQLHMMEESLSRASDTV